MWNTGNYGSTESLGSPTVQGPKIIRTGPFYVLQKSPGTIGATSTTETSLFTRGTSTNIGLATYAGDEGTHLGSRILPAGSLNAGTIIRGVMYGKMQTNATPDLTLISYLNTTAVATTAATTLTASAAETAFKLEWVYQVYTDGAAGVLHGFLQFSYLAAAKFFQAPMPSITAFNTNKDYVMDLTATFSASHADNNIIPYFCTIGIEG